MATMSDLLSVVDVAFETTALGLARWPDPHAGRSPSDDEYSRVTEPDKWRILGARVDAWLVALERLDLATIDRDEEIEWTDDPRTSICRTDVATPKAPNGLRLVVARSRIKDIEDAGVTVAVGNPATYVTAIPPCGCDACDHGSQSELASLDRYLASVVSGVFRRLTADERIITVIEAGGWSATGPTTLDEVNAILDHPVGWTELSGAAWL